MNSTAVGSNRCSAAVEQGCCGHPVCTVHHDSLELDQARPHLPRTSPAAAALQDGTNPVKLSPQRSTPASTLGSSGMLRRGEASRLGTLLAGAEELQPATSRDCCLGEEGCPSSSGPTI